MSLLKDKWVWISALVGALLAVVLSMIFVAANAAPAASSGTLTVTNVPVYGGTAEFATTTSNIKKTYYTYITLVCQAKSGTNPTYVQYSVGVDANAADTASIPLKNYYTGPGGFPWNWNGERAECSAWLTARSDNARGKDGYDMPVLAQTDFVVEAVI